MNSKYPVEKTITLNMHHEMKMPMMERITESILIIGR